MTDRGIIFSAPMVRALHAGRKTQTRRLLNPQPDKVVTSFARVFSEPPYFEAKDSAGRGYYGFRAANGGLSPYPKMRFGIGDRLYVREGWAVKRCEPCLSHERGWQSLHGPTVRYLADGAEIEHQGDRSTGRGIYHGPVEKGRPSIHMPRWASRMWLAVTDVRVQRSQDISDADAIAEGIIEYEPTEEDPAEFSYVDGGDIWNDARGAYAALWNTLHNDPGARWEDNPWVVAITFDVNHGNIDTDVGHGL